jgi:hypothetical protein
VRAYATPKAGVGLKHFRFDAASLWVGRIGTMPKNIDPKGKER